MPDEIPDEEPPAAPGGDDLTPGETPPRARPARSKASGAKSTGAKSTGAKSTGARATRAKSPTAKAPAARSHKAQEAGDEGVEAADATVGEPEPVTDGDDGPADSETPSHGWPARARAGVTSHPVTVAVASAVIVVVLTVALVLALLALGNRDAVNGARSDALAAARTYSVELAGYDYRHLDRDFGTVLANSTPRFRRSFAQSSSALKATLTRYHATAVAKIVSSGLVSATTSRAVVLVFLNQRITNTLKTPSTDRSQVEITLVHTGGRWLIDDVSLL